MVRKMRDIMSPAPICMTADVSVSAAAKAMKQHGIGTVPQPCPASHQPRRTPDRESLAGLLAGSGQPARLAAALVRVSLSQRAASEVTASVPD